MTQESDGQMNLMALLNLLEKKRRLPCPSHCPREVSDLRFIHDDDKIKCLGSNLNF